MGKEQEAGGHLPPGAPASTAPAAARPPPPPAAQAVGRRPQRGCLLETSLFCTQHASQAKEGPAHAGVLEGTREASESRSSSPGPQIAQPGPGLRGPPLRRRALPGEPLQDGDAAPERHAPFRAVAAAGPGPGQRLHLRSEARLLPGTFLTLDPEPGTQALAQPARDAEAILCKTPPLEETRVGMTFQKGTTDLCQDTRPGGHSPR